VTEASRGYHGSRQTDACSLPLSQNGVKLFVACPRLTTVPPGNILKLEKNADQTRRNALGNNRPEMNFDVDWIQTGESTNMRILVTCRTAFAWCRALSWPMGGKYSARRIVAKTTMMPR
jgi:hypothetical protein